MSGFKVKKRILLFFLLFFLADHCLWLINVDNQKKVYEVCWIVFFVMFIFAFLKTRFKTILSSERFMFSKEVIFLMVMGIYSSIQSLIIHGQSLAQGLAPQRFVLFTFLFYYVVEDYLNTRKNAVESIKKMFLTIGYLEIIVYIVQYLVFEKIKFLQIEAATRMGELRLNFAAVAIHYAIFHSINNMFEKKRILPKDVLVVLAGMFYFVEVAKIRLYVLAYAIAIIGAILIWKKAGTKRIVSLFIVVVAIAILTQTQFFSFIIEGLNNKDSSSKTRTYGREYYLSKIVEHPILGCGYINTDNEAALEYSGMYSLEKSSDRDVINSVITWVDLGVFGLTFFFGLVGLIWFITLYARMTYKAYQISKNGNMLYIMYMIFSIVISPNMTSFLWYIGNALGFVIWLCLLEKEYKDCVARNAYLELISKREEESLGEE